jgi:amino acid transporter
VGQDHDDHNNTRSLRIIGFDGAVHMSEEVRRARHAVPRSMFYTVAVNGLLAYSMVICVLFTMGPLKDAQTSSFPIIEICLQATGSKPATTAMVCGLLIISLSVNLASIASVSRLTWAWARDGALPEFFAYVCPTIPVSDSQYSHLKSRLTEVITFQSEPCGFHQSLS